MGSGLDFEYGPTTPVQLQFATYFDASDQASLSRVYGGIHPPADDFPGRRIGHAVGPAAWDLAMQYFRRPGVPEPASGVLWILAVACVAHVRRSPGMRASSMIGSLDEVAGDRRLAAERSRRQRVASLVIIVGLQSLVAFQRRQQSHALSHVYQRDRGRGDHSRAIHNRRHRSDDRRRCRSRFRRRRVGRFVFHASRCGRTCSIATRAAALKTCRPRPASPRRYPPAVRRRATSTTTATSICT